MTLKDYLVKFDRTQAYLSRKTGITKDLICKYTHGDRTPNLRNAKKIVEATKGKVSFEELIVD